MSMHRLLASGRAFALGWLFSLLVAGCASGPAQWTFQPTPQETPVTTGSPAAAACSPDATVVRIEETITLKMDPDTVEVTAGEKVCFEATNTGGIAHNFYVGPTADIESRNQTAAVAGTPDFTSGTQALEYTFSGGGPFEYACWIPGHLEAGMKGTIVLK